MRWLKWGIPLGLMLSSGAFTVYRVQGDRLNWLTSATIWLCLGSALWLLLDFYFAYRNTPREKRINRRTSLVSFMVILLVVEVGLRQAEIFAGYAERNGASDYYSPLKGENQDSWYYLHPPGISYDYPKTEFTFKRTTNSLGLSEQEIPLEKALGEFRILFLGDSFTEGDGVDYDSTWVKVVERGLQARFPGRMIRSINAGIGGSDPIYQCKLLEDSLLVCQPDAVIALTNSSDFWDMDLRGGFERFQEDGRVVIREHPAWEWLYGASYTFRVIIRGFLGYSENFNAEHGYTTSEMTDLLLQGLQGMHRKCLQAQIPFLVLSCPLKMDLDPENISRERMAMYTARLAEMDFPYFDLEPDFIAAGYSTQRLSDELFWPINGHYKPAGYQMLGEFALEKVLQLDWLEEEAGPMDSLGAVTSPH